MLSRQGQHSALMRYALCCHDASMQPCGQLISTAFMHHADYMAVDTLPEGRHRAPMTMQHRRVTQRSCMGAS